MNSEKSSPIFLLNGKISVARQTGAHGIERVRITDSLHEGCKYCGEIDCVHDCDESSGDDAPDITLSPDTLARVRYNAAIDGITSLLLAIVCDPDVFVWPEDIEDAIRTAVETAANHYS